MVKPILFSTPMVQAILAGRKTQTRRVVKGTPLQWLDIDGFTPEFVADPENHLCPYGKGGDILYVREKWFPVAITGHLVKIGFDPNDPQQTHEITVDPERIDFYWRQMDKAHMIPGIHMPKEAARIFLKITDIKIERLQNISEEDANAEGAEERSHRCGGFGFYEGGGNTYECACQEWEAAPIIMGFKDLWSSINGEESWNLSPWVWVVSFERTDKPCKSLK